MTPSGRSVTSIRHLLRGVLHEVGGHAGERPADSPLPRHATAADGIDHAAGGIRAVLHREPDIDLDRCIGEAPSFHPQEANLVVALPRNVVARADVDLRGRKRFRKHALHRSGLGPSFRLRAGAIEHVEEIGVAARVQLVGAVERRSPSDEQPRELAVQYSGAELRLDVVPDDREAPPLELLGPLRVGGDEDRNAVDEPDAGFEAGASIELRGSLAADG